MDWNNKEKVLEAVKNDGYSLQYASDELKNDKEVVLTAVKQNGNILEYLPYKYKNDYEIVLEAIKSDGDSIQFASKNMKDDKSLVLKAIKNGNPYIIDCFSSRLRNDKEIVIEALKKDKMAFCYIGEKIKEKYFPEEKNYSPIQVNFILKKPWERLEDNNFLNKSDLER